MEKQATSKKHQFRAIPLVVNGSRASQAFLLIILLVPVSIDTFPITNNIVYTMGAACPLHHYMGINVLDYTTHYKKDQPSKAGETVALVCQGNNYPQNYVVYPVSELKCQSNGTWSLTVPPICVNRNDLKASFNEVWHSARYFLHSECNHLLKSWLKVGQLASSFESLQRNWTSDIYTDEYELQFVNVTFQKSVYLSFMTFSIPRFDRRPNKFAVELFVNPKNVLRDVDSNILQQHYDAFKESKKGAHEAALTNIAVFTNEILAVFITSKGDDYGKKYDSSKFVYSWFPKPNFFGIPGSGKVANQERCPEEPSIANATVSRRSPDGRLLAYTCNDGYIMVDSLSDESPSATVHCENNQWLPYTLPVCRQLPVSEKSSSWRTNPTEDLSSSPFDTNTPIDMSTHSYLMPKLFICILVLTPIVLFGAFIVGLYVRDDCYCKKKFIKDSPSPMKPNCAQTASLLQ